MIKKFLAVSASAIMMLAMSVSAFAAGTISADEQKILDELKAKNVPTEYVAQAEKYLTTDGVDVTAAQATEIIADIDSAAAEVEKAGIKTIADLKKNSTVLNSVASKAEAAAKVVNVTLTVNTTTGAVKAVDASGKVIFEKTPSTSTTTSGTSTASTGTLKRTGADSMSTVAVVSVLGLAVATLAVATKKNAEA